MEKSSHSCLTAWLERELTQTLVSGKEMEEGGRMKGVRTRKLKVEGKQELSKTDEPTKGE